MFTFNYKDLREVTIKQQKIELLLNAKLVRTKQRRWNPRYTTMVKEELDKLLETRFIILMEAIEWFLPMVLVLKQMAS